MNWNTPPRTILVPYDVEHPCPTVLRIAAAMAPAQAAVTALFVVTPFPAQATLSDARNLDAQAHLERPLQRLRAALDSAGLQHAHARVAFGPPGPNIVDAVARDRPDLLVMATHARRGLQRLVLGSVTEYVLRHAQRPVLVLPPGDDEPADGAP
jgi:nucleotide-binding universal stress UspA family protein